MLPLASVLLAALVLGWAQATYSGPPNAHCTRSTYHITLPTYTTVPFSNLTTLDPSQPLLTELLVQWVSNTGNFTELYESGTNSSSGASYDISGVLCVPKEGDKHIGTVQLLVHGIAFDSGYWDIGFQPENYSYVLRAAADGYTTFRYDRLGTGESAMPFDAIHEVQAATDLQILLKIISLLHSGGVGDKSYSTILGIGHSYGSIQLTAAAAAVPDQLSALVLTGFSANGTYVPQFQMSNAFSRANEIFPSRFSSLPGGYVVSGLPQSAQVNFFTYPFYDPGVAAYSVATSAPVTLGVLFTFGGLASPTRFTGPVHVVTGARDWVFCGAQCDIKPDGVHTILELVGPALYPNSSNFSTYSPQNTGHGANMHFSTPATYTNIFDWFASVGF